MPTAYGANNTWYSRQGCAVVTCNKISGGRNYAENSTDRKWMGERY